MPCLMWLSWLGIILQSGRFNSQSGYMPRFQVWSSVGAHKRGNWLMFLSHINVSLSPFLPLSLKVHKIFFFNVQKIWTDIQVAKKQIKRYSTSLVIREMQIKIIMRYHSTPIRMSKFILKSCNNLCSWILCKPHRFLLDISNKNNYLCAMK